MLPDNLEQSNGAAVAELADKFYFFLSDVPRQQRTSHLKTNNQKISGLAEHLKHTNGGFGGRERSSVNHTGENF